MTDQMLKDAFERLADRAEPVDGLAERAIRRAGRRRAVMLSGAVAAAAMVAVPFVVLGGGTTERPGTVSAAPGLPANSPADRAVVQACLRGGSPTGPMGDVQPRLGKLADFRLLTSTKAGAETVALVGSDRGFVMCARGKEGNTEPPIFTPWPGDVRDGMWNFGGAARIDVVGYLTRTGPDGTGSATNGLHHLIAGRVKPGAAKVVVTWDRGRTVEATVRNGFFLARVDSTTVKATGKKVDRPAGTKGPIWVPRDEHVLTVEVLDKAGKSLHFYKAPGKGTVQFDPVDCSTPRKVHNLVLCGQPPKGG